MPKRKKERTESIHFRATLSERERLQAIAKKHGFKSQSHLIRTCLAAVLCQEQAFLETDEDLATHLRTIRGVATNINQLARKVNSGEAKIVNGTSADFQSLRAEVHRFHFAIGKAVERRQRLVLEHLDIPRD